MNDPSVKQRDRLFAAIVASQGFASDEQLGQARAMDSPLPEALIELGCLSDHIRACIDAFVDEHLARQTTLLAESTVSIQQGDPDETLDFDVAIRPTIVPPNGNGAFAGYELLGRIGKGGMGVVYKARQQRPNRLVALKMIKACDAADSEEIERFKAEAEAAANLEHPGIVPIFEVGESDGRHYFSMGLVEGQSMAERLRDGPLESRSAAEIVRRIADAVAYAHSNQIIHRDLKPGNILMDGNQPRVTDFGLAKQLASNAELTATGQVMGTPSYMPPEQAKGEETGPAADIYSLGAILYAATTGRPPHQAASSAETLLAVISDEPAPPRIINNRIPKDLETICLRCPNKDPKKRYPSAEALSDDLSRWLNNEPIKARRVGRLEKSWLWCKRKPVVAGLAAALILVVTVGSTVAWERSNAQHSQALVDSLVKAEPSQVKGYIDQIEDYRWWTEPLLEARHAAARDDSSEKVYLGLALLRFDPDQSDFLWQALLDSDPRNFGVVRDELALHKDKFVNLLWARFRYELDVMQRFRAGLALAAYAPADERWKDDDAKFMVDTLLSQIPEEQPVYRRLLVDIKKRLYPELKRAFLDPDGKERQTLGAAKAFAEYAFDDIGRVADVAADATVDQWQVLYNVLKNASSEPIHAALRPVVSQQPAEDLSPRDRVKFGKRRAGAAITLLRKGDREQIFDALRVTDDPESLTQFVHSCKERGVTPQQLLECLDPADKLRQGKSGEERRIEDRVLFGILLALGEFKLEDMPDPNSVIDRLADWYANDPSSAIHGATGWLLRLWGQEEIARKVDQTPVPYSSDREWYTLEIRGRGPDALETRSHMTFVVVTEGTYMIGSPDDEPGRQGNDFRRRRVKINRSFAVWDREVTWTEYANYDAKNASRNLSQVRNHGGGGWLPSRNEPWITPRWYDTVLFCRWLTKHVGLGEQQQAYPDPMTLDKSKYPVDPDPRAARLPIDWPVDLGRRGFRLLTESEWEVACRAGMRTSWSFGGDLGLLDRYGWFKENSGARTHDARRKRPNLRGLFDMHGNAGEWCHNWYEQAGWAPDAGRKAHAYRAKRGGSWFDNAETSRSSFRSYDDPAFRTLALGFRLATTLPPLGE